MPVHHVTRRDVCSRLHPTFPPGFSSLTTAFGSMVRRTSAPFRGTPSALSGGLWIPRAFRRPALASCAVLYPLRDWPALARGLLSHLRPQRGCHVPHRQAALGELASRRRERGTVSTGPLTPVDHGSSKDVSTPFVPSHHDGASTKASRMFNSLPTFPRIDFEWDSLLSFCVYGLLETPQLPATPRPYGNRRSVLAWSDWFRHLTYATSCRTNGPLT
jgi:hypothetical protein